MWNSVFVLYNWVLQPVWQAFLAYTVTPPYSRLLLLFLFSLLPLLPRLPRLPPLLLPLPLLFLLLIGSVTGQEASGSGSSGDLIGLASLFPDGSYP